MANYQQYNPNAYADDQGECGAMPDACGNVEREERLLERQRTKSQRFREGDMTNHSRFELFISRERTLIIACLALCFLLNWSTGRYILYPFKIFSTWIHEMCHGIAALLVGGSIYKLKIFPDGSGLATTAGGSTTFRRGFIASAGYQGTSVTGCLLLLFRRTTLGPTVGTIGMGLAMALSVLLYVRNQFGMWFLGFEAFVLVVGGWLLPAAILDHLYSFLAATCCLNAVESIDDLFAPGSYYVGGEEVTSSDAHTVSEVWGGDYRTWASFWFAQALVLTALGIIFARNARELPWIHSNGHKTGKINQQQQTRRYQGGTRLTAAPPQPPQHTQTAIPMATVVPQHQYQADYVVPPCK